MLKVSIKFGSVPQSFCQNLNPVQDQDQDHNFILEFNTRTPFYTLNTPTKFSLDVLITSKVIVHPDKF